MMHARTKTVATFAAIMITALGSVVGISRPAEAALPTCNATKLVNGRSHPTQVWVNIYGPTGSTDCILRQGNYNNAAVLNLQNTLVSIYDYNLVLDGDFGPATKAALYNLQGQLHDDNGRHIRQDGVYGPQTRDALCWYSTAAPACDFIANH